MSKSVLPVFSCRSFTSIVSSLRDFPGGPVVGTSPSNAGLIPGWRTWIPCALQPRNQDIKQKQYCNKFSKDFKNGPHQKKIVSSLTFRSLIHFEFIFVYGVRECSNFILLHVAVQLFTCSTTYWRDCLFSIVYSCLLHCRWIDPKCMGLFLGFLSCSVDLCVCFCASTILFWFL